MEILSFKEFMEQIGEVDLRKVTVGALVSGNSIYHLAEMIYEGSFVRYRMIDVYDVYISAQSEEYPVSLEEFKKSYLSMYYEWYDAAEEALMSPAIG